MYREMRARRHGGIQGTMQAVDELEGDIVGSVGQAEVHGLVVRDLGVERAVHDHVDVAFVRYIGPARWDQDEVRDPVGDVEIGSEDGPFHGERNRNPRLSGGRSLGHVDRDRLADVRTQGRSVVHHEPQQDRVRARSESQPERIDRHLHSQPSVDKDRDMACIRRGGTGPRLREVEVRHGEDDRHRTCSSNDRVVHGQQDGQGGRRRSEDIGCAPSGQEHQAHRRDEQGDGSQVHVPPPLGYSSSRGAIKVFDGSFLRRRIRMVTMKTSRKRTPPLRTSGRVADVDAVTWKFVVAETSGVSGVSSLFTSRIVRSWSPSGNETRNAGSTWTSSSSTLPSQSSWRWPSLGAFGCPCGSTRAKFVTWNETYMPWPVRSTSFGETILIVGTPPAGPWVVTTRTDVPTSGLSAFPTWSTSCRRIGGG